MTIQNHILSLATYSYTRDLNKVCLTFQRLVDVVIQVVHPQAVFEVSWVFLCPVSHHIDGYVTVVLPHLQQQETGGC